MGRHPEVFIITMSVVLSAASVVVAQDAAGAAGPETLATGPSTLATGPSTLAAGPTALATGPTTLATGPSTSIPLPTATVPIPSGTVPIPSGTVPIPSGTVPIPPGTVPIPLGTVPIPADLQQGTGTTTGNAGSVDITNAVVLSIDSQQRQLVIRNELGNTQTVVLGDNLAGFEGVTPGDSVVLSLQRQATGPDRVLSISLGGIVPSQSVPAAPAVPAASAAAPASATTDALGVFTNRVAALSGQAAQVDRLWSRLRGVCDVTVDGDYSSSREWLSLWEGQASVDLSNGTCRDLYDQVISAGEAVNSGMAEAEDQARKADLLPGTVRQTQQAFRMDWLGWGSASPARLG